MAPEGSARQQSGTKNEQVDLAIIGAGIAGLYCALKYNGTKFKTITIYETSGTLGGRLCTRYFPEEHPEFDRVRTRANRARPAEASG